MSEEINYILESLKFKTSIYRDKHKRNLTFNDDEYYSNILNEYIEELQQENQQLKEELKYSVSIVEHNKCITNIVKEKRELKSILDEIREYSSDLHLYDNESLEFKISNELFEILDKVKRLSLDKAIKYGKEKRKPYCGCKAVDPHCRNHGNCPWCRDGRLHKHKKNEQRWNNG